MIGDQNALIPAGAFSKGEIRKGVTKFGTGDSDRCAADQRDEIKARLLFTDRDVLNSMYEVEALYAA